jgi:hypothetical protein
MLKKNGTIVDTLTPDELAITDFSLQEAALRLARGQPTRALLDIRPSLTGQNDHVAIFPIQPMSKYVGEFLFGVRSCPRNYTLTGEEINQDPICQTLGIEYSN